MKHIMISASLLLGVIGCSSFMPAKEAQLAGESKSDLDGRVLMVEDDALFQGHVGHNTGVSYYPTQNINHYIQSLTHDLVSNLEYMTTDTALGVTTFSYVDSDLNKGSLLGNHLSEAFMHEFHKMRIPVIDFKLTKYIRVTDEGDFALSRDFMELDDIKSVEYILTGTFVNHRNGVLVNARIVGVKSRAVVASAQTLLPAYTVDDLLNNSEKVDGVRLK